MAVWYRMAEPCLRREPAEAVRRTTSGSACPSLLRAFDGSSSSEIVKQGRAETTAPQSCGLPRREEEVDSGDAIETSRCDDSLQRWDVVPGKDYETQGASSSSTLGREGEIASRLGLCRRMVVSCMASKN